ncbi:MAG: hypothetical protein LRZ98_00505 [Candidatus Pacebacteria bacterium]|nr:hypothetical protein [Candidatus Paceibacterota bacterium]
MDLRTRIKVLSIDSDKYKEYGGKIFETSVGRLLFNAFLPSEYPFQNKLMDKKNIKALEVDLINNYNIKKMSYILDRIKDFGFKYATLSGTT